MTPSLHFFCGKAGSGKSHLARSLTDNLGAVVLSEDIWLARLFSPELESFDDYLEYSRRIKAVVAPLVIDLLKKQSVVLDFPANTIAGRLWFRGIFESAGVPHTLHFIDAPDALCLARIAGRNQERPEGSHELLEAMFHHITSFFQAPGEEEGFNVRRYAPEDAGL